MRFCNCPGCRAVEERRDTQKLGHGKRTPPIDREDARDILEAKLRRERAVAKLTGERGQQ